MEIDCLIPQNTDKDLIIRVKHILEYEKNSIKTILHFYSNENIPDYFVLVYLDFNDKVNTIVETESGYEIIK